MKMPPGLGHDAGQDGAASSHAALGGPERLRGADRGKPGKDTEEVGAKRYIGLQSHFQTKLVLYRNIFIKPV